MTSRLHRLPLRAAAVALASLAAAAFAGPVGSDQFAPTWQADAQPLYNQGRGLVPDTNKWFVPATLPRGHYVLANRVHDQGGAPRAELIDGFRFEVTSATRRDLYMMVPRAYGDVIALPVADVPDAKVAAAR
jgi:hypothetical protein